MAKKKAKAIEQISIDPDQMNPQSAADHAQRGWLFYSRGVLDRAEADFRTALQGDPENADILYGLALTLKASGASTKALDVLDQAVKLADRIEDKQRAQILVRLVRGQINQIQTGDWNLEKEVWKRTE